MAIRVLLDHGVPEQNIIFLAFLISRHGQLSVRRAFPGVKIVTAAVDTELYEMHLPMTGLIMGEAAGEADFAVRLVDAPQHGDEDGVQGYDINAESSRAPEESFVAEKDQEQEGTGDGFRIPITPAEKLKFSRKKKEEGAMSEKRAWVVSPGTCQPRLLPSPSSS